MKLKKDKLRFGFLIDAIDVNYQELIIKGVRKFCKKNNIGLIIYTGSILFDNDKRQGLYEFTAQCIYKNDIDGLLVLTGGISESIGIDDTMSLIKSIKDIPIVSISTDLPGYSSVLADNEMGIDLLFKHLHCDHKFSRIAFISGPKNHDEAEKRLKAYKNCIKKSGLAFSESYIACAPSFDKNSGYNAMNELLKNNSIAFDAVMAVDDSTAMGAVQCLNDHGFSVPEDITVTGFDDTYEAKYFSPSLTTVFQSFFDQGFEAANTLRSDINGAETSVRLIETRLIRRDSCGYSKYKKGSKELAKFEDLPLKQQEEGLCFIDEIVEYIHKSEDLDVSFIVNSWKKAITRTLNDNKSLTPWSVILSRLIGTLDPLIISWETRQELFSSLSEVLFGYLDWEKQRTKLNEQDDSFGQYYISHKILSSLNKNDLFKVLHEYLPEYGIKSFYVCLLQENLHVSELPLKKIHLHTFLACSHPDSPVDKLSTDMCSNRVLLPDLLEDSGDLIFLPLFFNALYFGYVLFDYNEDVPSKLYEILRVNISSALHSCLLLNKLEESVSEKTNFLINLTHEIKTPLSIISSYIDKYKKNPKSLNDIEIAQTDINKLKRDMDNILDYEKNQKGIVCYNHDQRINISDFLKEKIKSFEALAQKAAVSVKTSLRQKLYVKIAASALDRILNNLLENAIKYNVLNGSIEISLKEKMDFIILTIRNTGLQIPDSMSERIFSPYFQLHQNSQGIGMGLSIVKQIVQEVGGSIALCSNDSKTGFEITFPRTFPIPSQINRGATVSVSMPVIPLSETIKECEFDPKRNTLLVVEDNSQMLAFLTNQLGLNFNVYYATSPTQAMAKLNHIPKPDLIISDVMMEDRDGLDFLSQLSSSDHFYDIPFLFLSAKNVHETKLKAIELGAVDYITKPFSIEILESKIKSLIQLQNTKKTLTIHKLKKDLAVFFNEREDVSCSDSGTFILPPQYMDVFTEREEQVIGFLAKGLLYKEISVELGLSVNTVKTYIKRIYAKLQVNNRVEMLGRLNWKPNCIIDRK